MIDCRDSCVASFSSGIRTFDTCKIQLTLPFAELLSLFFESFLFAICEHVSCQSTIELEVGLTGQYGLIHFVIRFILILAEDES